MAPEQIAGGRLSPQTDLYAVGLLLFELLAGTPAYGLRAWRNAGSSRLAAEAAAAAERARGDRSRASSR